MLMARPLNHLTNFLDMSSVPGLHFIIKQLNISGMWLKFHRLLNIREYGTTYEGRVLGVCIVSSEENLSNLEELRKNNLIKTGLTDGNFTGKQVPFIWLAYNVHGNESAGMETAMKTLYTLVTGSYPGVTDWLKNCVIIIDPCQNPDGRDLLCNEIP